MSFQKENYEIYNICLTFLGISFVALSVEWAMFHELLHFTNPKVQDIFTTFYFKAHPKSIFLRIVYVFTSLAIFYLKPPVTISPDKDKTGRLALSLFIIALFLFGFSPIGFYNLFIYPFIMLAVLFSAYLIFTLFGTTFKDENIFGISNEDKYSSLSYTYQTDQGQLTIHSAEQHIYVQGGSGAGKSDSILKPTLYQHVFKDFPALIYDYKGNPPTLGKTAHTAFVHANLDGIIHKTKLKYLNFADITRSNRVNPFSKRYLKDYADIDQLVSILLKNYSASFREGKDDFWFKGAKAIWGSLILRIQNDRELSHHLCLPLLVELLLTDDKEALIAFITEDREARKILTSVSDSKGNEKQFTGYITSANDLCGPLVGKNLYWLMSQDDINLNINTNEEPTFFCIAAVEGKETIYTPIVAMIIDVTSRFFLEQNKLPTLFQLDEIYTLYLENLPMQANVLRSNKVCLQIGNQLLSQMTEKYGKKANILMGACGNQFFGQSSDVESSETIVKLLSDVDKHTVSISTSDSNISVSDGLKRQKAREVRDIASQPTGTFTGKIANGKPPYFSASFERYQYHAEEIEIPPFVLDHITLDELEKDIDTNYNNICNLAEKIINNYRNLDN
ncbi:MAG: hypothetical protein DI589_18850 [Shinella sp.]|nr:MAG: hypothetical protein DI589_18850 [Shinella sp.]